MRFPISYFRYLTYRLAIACIIALGFSFAHGGFNTNTSPFSSYASHATNQLRAGGNLLFATLSAIPNAQAQESVTARVLHVADGDTITVDIAGRGKVKVRLLEVDTFEVFQSRSMDNDVRQFHLSKNRLMDLGRIGSHLTKQLVHPGDTVTLVYEGRKTGVYGRDLAFVQLANGRVLNEELVRTGAALVYRMGPTSMHSKYLDLERKAREKRAGVWAEPNIVRYYDE